METFTALLKQFSQIFTWWVCVAPWEQAVRVRAGRHVRLLGKGIHVNLPFLDRVFLQSLRLRVMHLPMQTLQTSDGRQITIVASLGYQIADVLKLFETLHHAQDTLIQLTAVAIAEFVGSHPIAEVTPLSIETAIAAGLAFEQYGIVGTQVRVTDFATIRTLRLLMDQKWGSYGDALDVNKDVQA